MIRFAGCVALGDIIDCDAAERLEVRLTDENEQVRLGAAFALFRCGQRQRGHVLRRALREHSNESIRATAAMLMGRIGEPPAVRELALASDDESNVVSMQVVASMALLGDDESIDRLIQYAQGETVMRILALATMVELADDRTVEALRYRLRLQEPDEYLQHRLIAARALGRLGIDDGYQLAFDSLSFGPANAPSEMSPKEAREEVTRVRSLAALALGDIGNEAALSVLEFLVKTADDSRVQVAACTAICHIIPDPMGPPRRRAHRPAGSTKMGP
jgi:HEAT repeat protein